MGDLPPDAALRIARWMWPAAEWRSLCGRAHSDTHRELRFDPWSWSNVHLAELALIERGLADVHGRAILSTLGFGHGQQCHGVMASRIATASLDARVRALLVVVEEQERKP